MLGFPPLCAARAVVGIALASFACAERRPNSEASPIQLGVATSAPPPSSGTSALSPNSALSASNAPELAAPGPIAGSASHAAPSAPAPSAAQPSAAVGDALAVPPLLGPDGKPLPQTEERPRVDSAAFKRRIERLAEAIIRDDPSLARPTFFPVVAYEQVKAVAKPARDWQYRLIRTFEGDIHEYHRALGPNAEQARLAGIDVPEPSARWMKPGSEGNRLGYFRVLRSRLRISKADGKERSFEVTSMISWRGEWYVVHLNGFD